MELIAAILFAGPLGYFSSTRRRGLVLYLLVWAVIFPIQTIVVLSESSDGNDALYWAFNALFLAIGVGLNSAGHRLRRRRGRIADPAPSARPS